MRFTLQFAWIESSQVVIRVDDGTFLTMFRTTYLVLGTSALWLAACATDSGEADEGVTSTSESSADDGVVSDDGLGSSADALSGSAAVGATVYTTASVNFRAEPVDGDVLRTLPRSSAVKIVEAQPTQGFYQVEYQGTRGWVHGAYLSARQSDHRLSVTAVYLGSCAFLGNCASSDTRAAWKANKTIYFGCDGRDTCSDEEAYISVPRNGVPCGTMVTICSVAAPDRCVEAKVREKSDSNQRYELSVAAAQGIGADPSDGFYPSGGSKHCSGQLDGDGRVTISY